MMIRRFAWALLPLLLLGCEEDPSLVQVTKVPLTADQQVVADCHAIQDALDQYAAAHGGSLGEYYIHWNEAGLTSFTNHYTGAHEPSGALALSAGQIGVDQYLVCASGYQVLGYRITGYGRDHQLIMLESVANVPTDVRDSHDGVVENALVAADAARQFASHNNGEFPSDVQDTNLDGKSLIDYLPNGELLLNPATGLQTEPVDGSAANPGEVGYAARSAGDGFTFSYIIDGYGCLGTIVSLLPYPGAEDDINGWCHNLREAVEAFKTASGSYPHNLDTETTPGGKTVFALCFEIYNSETDFVNPYTQEHYFPGVGTASEKGEIAYQPIETAGVVTDYVITGRGFSDEIAHLGPYPPAP
jgi:hypothetical protein